MTLCASAFRCSSSHRRSRLQPLQLAERPPHSAAGWTELRSTASLSSSWNALGLRNETHLYLVASANTETPLLFLCSSKRSARGAGGFGPKAYWRNPATLDSGSRWTLLGLWVSAPLQAFACECVKVVICKRSGSGGFYIFVRVSGKVELQTERGRERRGEVTAAASVVALKAELEKWWEEKLVAIWAHILVLTNSTRHLYETSC